VADKNESGGSFTLGFILGGIIGGLVAMLVAPKAGSETRSDLAERSQVWRSRADEMAASMMERVGPSVELAKDKMAPASARTRSAPDGADLNGQDMNAEEEAPSPGGQVWIPRNR
jgi:gas vesicle protein